MKILQLEHYQSRIGFFSSFLLHGAVIAWFLIDLHKDPIGNDEMEVKINLNVFEPVAAPNFAEEVIESSEASSQNVNQVEQEQVIEEQPKEIEEVKTEPEIVEKVVEKPVEKPKPVEKKKVDHKKQPPKPVNNLAQTSKTKNENIAQTSANSQSQANTAPAAPVIGKLNYETSKGNPIFGKIWSLIGKHKKYPQSAQRMRKHGNCLIAFLLHKNGVISNLKLLSSSGHEILDESALETVRKASKEFPKDLDKDYQIEVPIAYKL